MLDFGSTPFCTDGIPSAINRFNMRWKHLFADNQQHIEGKKVLDLACNNGRMAYPCIDLGAEKVFGVEARGSLIASGKEYFDSLGISDRMQWHQADAFEFMDAATPGAFDVILCLGFLYHTTRQVDFFRAVKRLRAKTVIIDSSIAKNYFWFGRTALFKKPPALFMSVENPRRPAIRPTKMAWFFGRAHRCSRSAFL